MTFAPLEAVELSLVRIKNVVGDSRHFPETVILREANKALDIIRGIGAPTAEQKRCLGYIKAHLAANGEMPTYREMKDGLGYASSSAPHRLVMQLVNRGKIRLGRSYTARSLRLVG